MTALEWDKVGDRRYQTGVDHGVLYLPDGGAVPWNGLTSIAENLTREVKSYYLDGIKYLDHIVLGSYSAKLTAYTYPDELETFLGNRGPMKGVMVYDQMPQMFNLSYRTLMGNDLDGTDHGYRIHLLYNLLAVSDDVTMSSLAGGIELATFSWSLTGVPVPLAGMRPTNHISLDVPELSQTRLTALEKQIYGSEDGDPELPPLVDILNLLDEA